MKKETKQKIKSNGKKIITGIIIASPVITNLYRYGGRYGTISIRDFYV
jgi:hypothetical protein